MESIPLPSRIHYEALLQLLEKESLSISTQHSTELRRQIQELMFTIRKALSQQKQIENCCEQLNIPFEYHWSLIEKEKEKI